jgi:hypothetical protein
MADRSADRHKYDRRYFRPEPTLYERAKAILRARGSNVNDYLEECLRRLVGEAAADDQGGTGADQERPPESNS